VAAPLLGEASAGGRRPVLIFSLLGTVVSFVMLAMAHTITMLFLARIVDGLVAISRRPVFTSRYHRAQGLLARGMIGPPSVSGSFSVRR
jgi:MFS family permease